MQPPSDPVLVIGGGPVGLAVAIALAARGFAVRVLEARPALARTNDPRVLALSYGTRLVLERLGAWPVEAEADPILTVHVSQHGGVARTELAAHEAGVPALGYVATLGAVMERLAARAAELAVDCVTGAQVCGLDQSDAGVSVLCESATGAETTFAPLVVQADGRIGDAPDARERDYHQWAIAAEVTCERARPAVAYERFGADGPIALLPRAGRHALIWTVPERAAPELLACDARTFGERLAASFGERVGAFRLTGERAGFPLALRVVRELVTGRVVRVGNAAQTLHPVAAQGFNLGLRDAFELARALARAPDVDAALDAYGRARRVDRAGGALVTDLMVRAFALDAPLVGAGRGLALALLDACPPAKRSFLRRMVFGARG